MGSLKSLLAVLLCSLITYSCYEEDIDIPLRLDEGLIIGKWEGYTSYLIYEDGSETLWEENKCYGYIMNFYEDGRLWYVDFVKNPALDDSCVDSPITKQDCSWKRISNGKYEFTIYKERINSEFIVTPSSIMFDSTADGIRTMTINYSTPPDNSPEGVISHYITLFRE